MKKTHLKYYGRKNINKLDRLLAITCAVIGIASLWISIGIAVRNAGPASIPAFADVLHGLGFLWGSKYGSSGVAVTNSILFYGSLLCLVIGCIYLSKKNKKERIPGLVATFIAMIGFIFFLSLVFEFTRGVSKGKIHGFWAYSSILSLICLAVLGMMGLYGAFSNCPIELQHKCCEEECSCCEHEEAEAEPEVEEPKEEPKEEPEEEPEEEEEPIEEPIVEGSEENFKGLGPRRRRIPFESKLKKADKETRARYNEIVEALSQYDLNDRISVPGETFSYKKEKLIFVTFASKTLKVYFALDPKEFVDSPIPMKDMSDIKKFEQTPCLLFIKSDLAARRAVDCARKLLSDRNVPRK